MTWFIGLTAFAVIFFREVSGNSMLYNEHSFMVVLGGTVATIFLLSSKTALFDLVKLTFSSFTDERKITEDSLKLLIQNPEEEGSDYHGIVSYARDIWLVGVEKDEFEQLLTFKAQSILNQNMSAISVLKSLGKYPPALGMIGTVLGMISLFKGISDSGNNQIGGQLWP